MMKKYIILFTIAVAVVLLFVFAGSDKVPQNNPDVVGAKLQEIYETDFKFIDSFTDSSGMVQHHFYPANNPKLIIEASYHYAGDPFYIFPFVKKVVFQDNMVDSIKDLCVFSTLTSYDVFISEQDPNFREISAQILECLGQIEEMFSTYHIDKNISSIYLLLNLTYQAKTVDVEFTPSSQELIVSKIAKAFQE